MSQDHPIFQTFLQFYQAICFESLGQIAHNYSGNKISLLEQARDFFIVAKETLPPPYVNRPAVFEADQLESPANATADILQCYSPFAHQTPCLQVPKFGRTTATVSPAIYSDSCYSPDQHEPLKRVGTPKFEDYSPRIPLQAISSNRRATNKDKSSLHTKPLESNRFAHKTRLSRSLSSRHSFADECVPSPLFSRSVAGGRQVSIGPEGAITVKAISAPVTRPLPLVPVDKPLPPRPFNHKASFVIKGNRTVVVPRRDTALATLISKYEARSPFDSPTTSEKHNPTPTTERFKHISAVFGEKAAKDQYPTSASNRNRTDFCTRTAMNESARAAQPITPCPQRRTRVVEPSTSLYSHDEDLSPVVLLSPEGHVDALNDDLAGFRTYILNHIQMVSKQIEECCKIQNAHEVERRGRFSNMHMMPRTPVSAKEQSSPVKDSRLRSFWNLQMAEAQDKDSTGNKKKNKELQTRIERLRADGWKSVSKEAKGWKGAQYYEKLREQAERELAR